MVKLIREIIDKAIFSGRSYNMESALLLWLSEVYMRLDSDDLRCHRSAAEFQC